MDKNGCYDRKYYFDESIDNIAKFITQNFQNETIITNQSDELICKSIIGGYLDIAVDDVLQELLPKMCIRDRNITEWFRNRIIIDIAVS